MQYAYHAIFELSEPGRKRSEPLPRRVLVAKAFEKRVGSKEPGGTGFKSIWKRLQSHSLFAYYFGHHQKCNFFFTKASEAFIFHWQHDWHGPVRPKVPPGAFHPKARACRSRFRTGGPPDAQTFQ